MRKMEPPCLEQGLVSVKPHFRLDLPALVDADLSERFGGVSSVSVIIPVFNRPDVLRRAIASVLAQTFKDYEVIIVDDGSTDPVEESIRNELKRSNIRLMRHDANRGAAASRNTGAENSKAHYVAFLDSDDEWHPNKLARQVAFMQKEPTCRASCTGFELLRNGEAFDQRVPPAVTDLDELLWGCRISPGSTLMIERSLYKAVGPMDERLRRLEDWDWLILIAEQVSIKGLREVLVAVHHNRYAHVNEMQFVTAVRRMADYSREGRYNISRAQRLILLSALQYEMAAMQYRKQHFGAAVRALSASFLYCPFKRRAHVSAAFKTVWSDMKRAIGPGR